MLTLKRSAGEGCSLFESRGFKLHKWIANSHAKIVLDNIPRSDLSPCVSNIDPGVQPLPDSSALGLTWDTRRDMLRIHCREFEEASTKRKMSTQLSSQFDPLGMASPFLLGGKLILQKVSSSGVSWDDVLPDDTRKDWKKWLASLGLLDEFSIRRNCLPDCAPQSTSSYQLHGFSDASNSAYSCVIHLRCWNTGNCKVSFVLGKSRLVLTHQVNWVVSRKELEAAKFLSELVFQACEALQQLHCSIHLWTDSQVVVKWLTNPDLNQPRFLRRRLDKIFRVAPSSAWNYIHTSLDPADVGTREGANRNPGSVSLWLRGPTFLTQQQEFTEPPVFAPVVRSTRLNQRCSLLE